MADGPPVSELIVRWRELQRQGQLLRVFLRSGFQARIGLDLEALGLGFSVQRNPHLVMAGRDAWALHTGGPHDDTGKRGGVGVAQVPDELVHALLHRHARGRDGAGAFVI